MSARMTNPLRMGSDDSGSPPSASCEPTGAEKRLLGALMLETQSYWQVCDLVEAADFLRSDYADLWAVIAELARTNKLADPVTISDRAPDLTVLAADLLADTYSAGNIRTYAAIVARDSTARKVRNAGARIAALDGEEALQKAQRMIGDCAPRQLSLIRHAGEFLRESVARMQQRAEADTDLAGIPTSFPTWDRLTGGFQPGDLNIIAARPSVGKTALALQCAMHAASHGHGALFVSLEMSGSQLIDRALAAHAGVDSALIRSPKRMPEEDWGRVLTAGTVLAGLPLRIDDASAQTVETLGARIRQAHFSESLKVVFIDYLGLIRLPNADRHDIAIGLVTKSLKALAKDLHIPVILLCQLNRGEGRPNLMRLRDSGDIEQDADSVAFLHRPDEQTRERLEFILAKQRNGPTGDFRIHADLRTQRMAEQAWETPVDPQSPSPRGFRSRRQTPQWTRDDD